VAFRPSSTPPDDGSPEFADACVQAVATAARDLHLDPAAFAAELAQGEIGLLVVYLREALPHLDDVELRERVGALLHRLTAWTGAG
jgi:hypothetical protein